MFWIDDADNDVLFWIIEPYNFLLVDACQTTFVNTGANQITNKGRVRYVAKRV